MALSNTGSGSNFLTTASAPLTAYPLTLACWYKSASLSTAQNLVFLTPGNYVGLEFDGTGATGGVAGSVVANASDNGSGYATSSVGITDTTTWHHCCAVFASATSRAAYLDGGAKGTNVASQTITGITALNIGIYPGGFSPLNGSVAHAAAWSVALADEDVSRLASGVCPLLVRPDQLVAYWPLAGLNSPEVDLAGRYPLTITGTLTAATDPSQVQPASGYFQRRNAWFLAEHAVAAASGPIFPNITSMLGMP